jgi:hypothetical protein
MPRQSHQKIFSRYTQHWSLLYSTVGLGMGTAQLWLHELLHVQDNERESEYERQNRLSKFQVS